MPGSWKSVGQRQRVHDVEVRPCCPHAASRHSVEPHVLPPPPRQSHYPWPGPCAAAPDTQGAQLTSSRAL